MKFPLSEPGKFNETQAHHGAVTRLKITYDDQYLITTGEDACVFLFKITDKEGKGLKLEREVCLTLRYTELHIYLQNGC